MNFANVKNITLTCSLLLVAFSSFAMNRIATQADQRLYGDYITPGDLIIDTPTKLIGNRQELIYYFMQKQWPGLKDGATIWLDGDKLGFLDVVKFCNTASPLMPWHIESVKIKNIPHTQVRLESFMCQGLKHVELNGESEMFVGLSQWPSERKFLSGSFGFHAISKNFGGHGFQVSVLDGGTIIIKGFEVQHGFSGVRINGGDYDITLESVEISNFYIHDTGNGEGMYLGATHKPPLAKIKNLKIYDGLITRTAAEPLQLQHLVGGTDVHHVTIRAADVRWANEFRAGQDTGIQWVVDAGENKLHHVILDGFGSVGLVPFGSDQLPVGGTSEISYVLFNDGIDTGMYLHNSGSYGLHWKFNNLYFRSFKDDDHYRKTGRNERRYIVSSKHGTDRYTFNHIIHDGSKQAVFQDTAGIEVGHIKKEKLPEPRYVNSGFHEPASKIRQWYQHYAGYFPACKSGKVKINTEWKSGDIAIETQGQYSFYKCIKAEVATEIRPSENPNFIKLTWDANGVRSDQPGWLSSLNQSDLPPDDLRLEEGSYWEKLMMGFPTRDKAFVLETKR